MFEILPNPSLETLMMVGRAVLLVGALWVFAVAFIRWRRADERATAALHAKLDRAFLELRSLHETVSVMSARLDGLSERAEVESRLAPAGSAAAGRGYDVAARLARNGAPIEELVNSCGVTRHEAELLVRLHGAKPREIASPPPAQVQTRMHQRPQQEAGRAPAVAQSNTGRKRGSLLSVVG